jgi:hypothetical protein
VPVTVDTKGRVRVSKEQRGIILAEFERSGVSAAECAIRSQLRTLQNSRQAASVDAARSVCIRLDQRHQPGWSGRGDHPGRSFSLVLLFSRKPRI